MIVYQFPDEYITLILVFSANCYIADEMFVTLQLSE